VLPRGGSHGTAQAQEHHDRALHPFGGRPFAGRLETIHLDLAWPDILDLDIVDIAGSKRRFDLRNWLASRVRRNVDLRRRWRGGWVVRLRWRLFGMRVQQRFDAKTSCGSVSFSVD